MAKTNDFYEILGVAPTASLDEIKKAYRKKAMELHPDRNPDRADAEERFKELTAAYAVISDPDKRAHYDRYGDAGPAAGPAGFNPEDLFRGGQFGGLEDLFESFFGGSFSARGAGGGASQGANIGYELEIEFQEAAFGTEVKLRLPRQESCPVCRGEGAPADGITVCDGCRGSGTIVMSTGFLRLAQTCPRCAGRGKRITKPCSECRGEGRVRTERTVKVRVPPGVDDGTRLRLAGEGHGGTRGGPAGDLYVDISVKPHPQFKRDGADVHAPLRVAYADLVLGGTFTVQTIHGEESFDLPAATEPGAQFALRGKGVQKLSGRGKGDHVVHVTPEVPTRLSERERELWEQLRTIAAETRQERRSAGTAEDDDRSLFDKVKDLFSGDR